MLNMIGKQIAVCLILLGGAFVASAANAQVKGGSAVVAQQSAPPTLDAMVTAAQAARNITMNIFETLVTRDENGVPIPDLAEKYDVSPDARSYTFHLRKGVKFHNGKEMTSADVAASLKRFGRIGGRAYLRDVQSIEATDPQTVVVTFAEPLANFIDQLSSIGAPAVIIPEEEAGKELGKIEVIGTGPYQLVEFLPDSHVTLERFEDYVPNPNFQERSGLGGKKTAYLDTVTFRFMPEAGARAAALETGEVQVVESLATPTARRLAESGTVVAYEVLPWAVQYIWMNASDGPTKNVKVRKAIQAVLDPEEIMAISTDGSYKLSWNWLYPTSPYYAGDVGKALYNQKNPELAKQLLQEGGYNGEEIVIPHRQQLQEPSGDRCRRRPATRVDRDEGASRRSRLPDGLCSQGQTDRVESLRYLQRLVALRWAARHDGRLCRTQELAEIRRSAH